MACLAVSLQPVNGPDLLLQTREWFPPARGLLASSKFRETRETYAAGKRAGTSPSATTATAENSAMVEGLGDEALAASGGHVIVGKETKFRVFYRLVNNIYVLAITSAENDRDDLPANAFECAGIVNQAVSVLVAACKGIDVTSEKVIRKYTEIYMALDVVLRGVSAARLSTILASIHGEGIPQMVLSATDAENRARGAESWYIAKSQAIEHLANIDALSSSTFELPEETIVAGDEVAATLVTTIQNSASQPTQQAEEEKPKEIEDPFAPSDKINKPEELAGAFKKSKDPADVTSALADLEVPKTVAGSSAGSIAVVIKGFEGDYGGVDSDAAGFGSEFEGLENSAFGGGLDASEFVPAGKDPIDRGLGGLEELGSGGKPTGPKVAVADTAKENAAIKELTVEIGKPVLYLSEEVFAEFKGSRLRRIGMQGSLFLKYNGAQETSFSFRMDGSVGVRRAIMKNTSVGSLGQNLFHVRSKPSEEPVAIMKYRLHPQYTPVPLRVRLVTRQSGSLLSLMIQYVANPFLPAPLQDVKFIVSLPYAPSLLKMSPKGLLNRHLKAISWHVQEVPLQGPPGCLRAQMPLDSDLSDADVEGKLLPKIKVIASIEFSGTGQSLSGITLLPGTEGNTDYTVGLHTFKASNYLCD
ncbi:hypothetical protein GOP47_0023243 [Adiantum capillus-veneris]|uniref:MHD domain-containing protein n=1 Tax=Adiantum capillus-veneris TaxID=13818 RepID=A0A9D4U6Z1_ADICA|nr:hypothetical protein GOP47_0023243 [Adiantum capillus-veneris]